MSETAGGSSAPRVGVCIGGWIGTARGLADGGESIRHHLLRPLGSNADVLLALRYEGAADCPAPSSHAERTDEERHFKSELASEIELHGSPTAAACQRTVRRSVHALVGTIRRLHIEPSPTLEELVNTLEVLPHWPQILSAYNSGLRAPGNTNARPKVCTRVERWLNRLLSPYRCTNVWGSYLSPVRRLPWRPSPSSYGHSLPWSSADLPRPSTCRCSLRTQRATGTT